MATPPSSEHPDGVIKSSKIFAEFYVALAAGRDEFGVGGASIWPQYGTRSGKGYAAQTNSVQGNGVLGSWLGLHTKARRL